MMVWFCSQDDDGDLLCVQPTHFVPPGRLGLARGKWVGRFSSRTGELFAKNTAVYSVITMTAVGGRIDNKAEIGWPQRLCNPDL